MGRKTWLAYTAIQIIGQICEWTWPFAHSAVGRWLWVGSFIFLLPGNFLAGLVVEKWFWKTSFTLFSLRMVQIPLTLGINLVLWMLCARLWGWVASRMRLRKSAPTAGVENG